MIQTEKEEVKGWLILLLAFIGGWVDAYGYLVLVQLFTAHMSGNSIAMTVYAGKADWARAFHRAFPIPLFVLGIFLGGTTNRVLSRVGCARSSP